ncbi:hypothetical protein [Brochothrix thermosphacta]|uniref:hypothetical protein n=1 Tax=Brochothrix thermosphacta TaxID=2756 RepID=UPI000EDBEE33|nr:hypothetical protein [Brochothrix thermosphacta]HCZ39767.1 hypothetical protein [Brochothrix thermosphacta]HCZ45497.1 hypothetical protein [Brochothrix thermosphacta]
MWPNTLKVKEALNFMREHGITMNEPAFRKAIRTKQMANTQIINKKDGLNIPIESLIDFMIPRLSGNIAAYQLGVSIQKLKYQQTVITPDNTFHSFSLLISSSLEDEYIYCLNNLHQGMNNYQLFIDYDHFIIHMYDDHTVGGTYVLNKVNVSLIIDVWTKLSMDITEELIKKTTLIIYHQMRNDHSCIASYGFDENQNIGIMTLSDENLYYKRFKNEIKR